MNKKPLTRCVVCGKPQDHLNQCCSEACEKIYRARLDAERQRTNAHHERRTPAAR